MAVTCNDCNSLEIVAIGEPCYHDGSPQYTEAFCANHVPEAIEGDWDERPYNVYYFNPAIINEIRKTIQDKGYLPDDHWTIERRVGLPNVFV